MVLGGSHVDVETAGAHDRAGLVGECVGDDDDVMNPALGVDDAMPGAERLLALPHLLKRGRDVLEVLGMLVGQHQFGGGRRGAGLIAVHLLDLR